MGNNSNKKRTSNKKNTYNGKKNYYAERKAARHKRYEEDEKQEKTEILELEDELKPIEKSLRSERYVEKKLFDKERRSVLLSFLIVLCSFVLGFSLCLVSISPKVVEIEKINEVEKLVMDENVVFVGDSIFELYDVKKFFPDRKVINSGVSGDRTTTILDNMERRIYRYNPSDVFLMIGTNDIWGKDLFYDKSVENIREIVKGIKKNRPYTNINVISVFPVNNTGKEHSDLGMVHTRTNDELRKMNAEIKKVCKEENVKYIDIFSVLIGEDDQLPLEYTTDGLHISEEGYKVISKELEKYLSEKKVAK